MVIFSDLGLYITLFSAPFVVYFLLNRSSNPKSVYSNKDWFYAIKFYMAKRKIKKLQQNLKKNSFEHVYPEVLEEPREVKLDCDTQIFYSCDQHGNSLTIKLIRYVNNLGQIILCLRLKDNSVYTFPDSPSIPLYSGKKGEWKGKGLNMEILEPLKRIRVTFNGLLKNISNKIEKNNSVEHIQFRFIFNSAGSPKFYPHDAESSILADAVALETWKDGDWLNNLDKEESYEQFGTLHGFVKKDSLDDEIILNLNTVRKRCYGALNVNEYESYINIFGTAKDGTLFNITLKSLKNGCKELKHGNLILSSCEQLPLTEIDIRSKQFDQSQTLPDIFAINFKAGRRDFKCIFYINKTKVVQWTSDVTSGYKLIQNVEEINLNGKEGYGVIEFWHNLNKNKTDCEFKLPKALLFPLQLKNLPNVYVTKFSDESAKNLEITGGKGNSLALLYSLNSKEFIVPNGFIVTTIAFAKQIQKHQILQNAIKSLEDVAYGRCEGNLEKCCDKTVELFQKDNVLTEIAEVIKKNLEEIEREQCNDGIENTRYAVRSSAVGEDSDELSAAGQNETILGCNSFEKILIAVSTCWASLYTFQSVEYRRQHGLAVNAEMAVVIQKMVPTDCAGVLFTCHPSTSNPAQIVITSNYGLGESVVSGQSDPDTIILNRTWDGKLSLLSSSVGLKKQKISMNDDGVNTDKVELDSSEKLSLTTEQAIKLGETGVFLENRFGNPRDIEWGFYKNQLYLLQSRPITTLNSWSDFELTHELEFPIMTDETIHTRANSGEVCPGAMTVLSETTTARAIGESLRSSTPNGFKTNLPCFQHQAMIDVIGGIHVSIGNSIDLTAKIIDLAVFGHPVIDENIHKISMSQNGPMTSLKRIKATMNMVGCAYKNNTNLKELKKCSEKLNVNISKEDDLKNVYQKIDNAMNDFLDILKYHCKMSLTSVFYQIVAMTVLAEGKSDFEDDHYHDIALLLSSCDNVESAEIPNILEALSNAIQSENLSEEFINVDPANGVNFLQNKSPKAYKIFQEFLEKHGHRLLGEFELAKESWAMNPANVISMTQMNCKSTSLSKKQSLTIEEVIVKLSSPKKSLTRKILKYIMSKSRVAVGMREQAKSLVVLNVNKIRLAYRKLADMLVSQGFLPDKDLIFHLTHYEVAQLINNRNPLLINKAVRRQRLYPLWDKQQFPEINYGMPNAQEEKVEREYNGNEITVKGTPVCSGKLEARACVITSLNDAGQLRSGDILITYSTDIGWSPYFPSLSGVVTELGGLISHGAVIAREYGLPCIVGIPNVTKIFNTGDIVLLCGKTGTLKLI